MKIGLRKPTAQTEQEELKALSAQIEAEVSQHWLSHARQGTRVCVPHLDQALLTLQLRGSHTQQEANRLVLLEQTRSLRVTQRLVAVMLIGLHAEQAADFDIIVALLDRLFDSSEEVQRTAAAALTKALCSSWDEKAETLLPNSRVVITLLNALERKNAPIPPLLDALAALAQRCPQRAGEITLSLRAFSRKDPRVRHALQYLSLPGEEAAEESARPALPPEAPPTMQRPEELARSLPNDYALLQQRDPAQRYRAALRLYRAEQAGYRLMQRGKTLVAVKIQDLPAYFRPQP